MDTIEVDVPFDPGPEGDVHLMMDSFDNFPYRAGTAENNKPTARTSVLLSRRIDAERH